MVARSPIHFPLLPRQKRSHFSPQKRRSPFSLQKSDRTNQTKSDRHPKSPSGSPLSPQKNNRHFPNQKRSHSHKKAVVLLPTKSDRTCLGVSPSFSVGGNGKYPTCTVFQTELRPLNFWKDLSYHRHI